MGRDKRPQMRAVSSNACPNSRPRRLDEYESCDMDAMTAWGYCNDCWRNGRVPSPWAVAVDQAIARAVRP